MNKLIEELKKLEVEISKFEIDRTNRQNLDYHVSQYVDSFLQKLPDAPAYQPDLQADLNIPAIEISETPVDIEALLKTIEEQVEKPGINTASGNYFGYIPCGSLYTAAIGDYLSAILNRYSGIFFMAPGAVRIEKEIINWAARLMGFPNSAFGNITSGASVATLIAILSARTAKSITSVNCSSSVVYLSTQTHYCVSKALRIAGLDDVLQRIIPVDEHQRMNIKALKETVDQDIGNGFIPWMIVATAGTTNTGAIDELPAIHTIALERNIWLHVDAAYGGFFKLTQSGKESLTGIELADSIALDAHKSLFMPYGTALILIKNHNLLLQAHSYTACYLQDAESKNEIYSPANLSPELTRPFRALRIWLSLQLLGVNYFRLMLEEKILLAKYFYARMSSIENVEFINEPSLSIVAFRYVFPKIDPNFFNQALQQELLRDGRIFLSTTTINGDYYLRFVCHSFNTHMHNVDYAIQVLTENVSLLSRARNHSYY